VSNLGLLEKCGIEVRFPWGGEEIRPGWRFVRHPDHWAAPWVLRGSLLVEMESPSIYFADRRPSPWAATATDGRLLGIPGRVARGFFEADRLGRESPYHEASIALPDTIQGVAPLKAFLEKSLPGIGLLRGDVLVVLGGRGRMPTHRRLSPQDLRFLRTRFQEDESLLTSLNPFDPWDLARDSIRDYPRSGQARGLSVHAFRPRGFSSFRAPSDEAAISRLIRATGCRMPD